MTLASVGPFATASRAVSRVREARNRGRVALVARSLEPRLVWVLGSPRSGTTWLTSLLAGVIGARVVDEPLIGVHLGEPTGVVTSVRRPDDTLVIEASAARPDYFFAETARTTWQPALRTMVLRRLAVGTRRDGPVIVKEPNGSAAARVLLGTFPRSRVLFVVRDGRDVVDSMLDGVNEGWITETHGGRLDPCRRHEFIEERAHHWVRTVGAVADAYRAHPASLRHRVRYESLRADAATEVRNILRWLGRDDAMADVDAAVALLDFDALPTAMKGQGRFARAATPGLWREHFGPEECAAMQRIMGPTLAAFGYE